MDKFKKLTVGDLIEILKNHPIDNEVTFSGLDFLDVKDVGDHSVFSFIQDIIKKENGEYEVINHKFE